MLCRDVEIDVEMTSCLTHLEAAHPRSPLCYHADRWIGPEPGDPCFGVNEESNREAGHHQVRHGHDSRAQLDSREYGAASHTVTYQRLIRRECLSVAIGITPTCPTTSCIELSVSRDKLSLTYKRDEQTGPRESISALSLRTRAANSSRGTVCRESIRW